MRMVLCILSIMFLDGAIFYFLSSTSNAAAWKMAYEVVPDAENERFRTLYVIFRERSSSTVNLSFSFIIATQAISWVVLAVSIKRSTLELSTKG